MKRAIPAFDYKPLPEVYQIECTNACNLSCPRCTRRDAAAQRGGVTYLDPEQLRGWVARGDLAGSWYVELQMSGEPLLHPRFGELVRILQQDAGVAVGVATSGQLLERRAADVALLDAVTVSIDTDDPAMYPVVRPGATYEAVERGIAALLSQPTRPQYLNIFTIEDLEERSGETRERVARLAARFPEFTVTSAVDCSAAQRDPGAYEIGPSQEVCVNPWLSVSVHSDGGVVSCCYAWDRREPNWYGNLNECSLVDIWAGQRVREMRALMEAKVSRGYCQYCYARSPFRLHLDGLARALREVRRGAAHTPVPH